ncbi:MAG: hypothetical protein EXQ52_11015 [Bryobacterales bacterium]|nr:hypothetical protein [Bryobacterales bacterium]
MPQTFFELAAQWFRSSGIQEPGGGVARYYLTEKKRNLPVSTEITGYAVSSLVYLHSLTGDAATLESAVLSARFLTRSAWVAPISIFPFELDQPFAYFFDCGIVVRALLAIYRATGNQECLDIAVACGRTMARDFVAPDGCIHAVLNLPSRQPLVPEPRWSRSPGCYQLKAALAWHELFEETGDPDFEAYYARALEHALATHESFLPGAAREGVMDRLHAYAYFLEGLLPRLEDPRCADALRMGLDRANALLLEISPVFERSDVRAQLLRVRLFGHALGALPLDESAASAEAALISAYQREDSDRAIHGGFFFGKKGQVLLPYVNPVSTGFCAQALALWREHQGGGVKTCRRMLV